MIFKTFLLICFLFVNYATSKEVVCYVPTWVDISAKIDTSLCSIFVLAFGSVDASGNVVLPDNFANYKAKIKTSTSKLMLALGGATSGTSAFKAISASASLRNTFATNCLNLAKSNALDGFDIDWEFPDSIDRANFVILHQALKTTLGSSYLVSSAVSVGQWLVKTNNVYDIAGLAKAVDHINLMTYDMHMDQSWDSSFGVYFNAPVKASSGDSVVQGINFYLQGGAPASKLMVGVPFYGRQYQLSQPSQNAPKSPFNVGNQASNPEYTPMYNQYCSKLTDSSWTKRYDNSAQCPYLYKGNLWLSYEDSNSIITKGDLANQYNLGGVMTWALHQDDYIGLCSSCKWPLLKALNSAVGRGTACDGSGSSQATSPSSTPTTSRTTTTKHFSTTTTSKTTTTKRSTTTKAKSTSKATTTKSTTTTRGKPTTSAATTSASSADVQCPNVGAFISNPSDCTKFYQCDAGNKPILMSCGPGTFWNKAISTCDWTCNN